ncbi:dodecin domain-containing protein [bacterium]|nr:dodecin domain-containing protein [bacterium]
MSVVKVIEVIAESEKGWEDAAAQALTEAQRSIRNVSSIYIKDFKADVENGKITSYRVNAKVSFLLEG